MDDFLREFLIETGERLDVVDAELVRLNAADHVIETTHERNAAGKPDHGTIRLRAGQEGGTITIEITDDGRGLDHDAIRRKAVAPGLVGEADVRRLGDAQVAKFIFHPHLSTAAAVTSISGRGAGMDVVKDNMELIGGMIEIRSEKGRGTTFAIKIPLTLAIVAALVVSVKDERFAIQQQSVQEFVRLVPDSGHSIEHLDGRPLLRLRRRLLPIVRLPEVLASLSRGVHRLDRQLSTILDVDADLALEAPFRAA
jgi:two-component system, chemotaxis family, sensor kinase CheA